MKNFNIIKLLIIVIIFGTISLLVISSINISKKKNIQQEQIEYNDSTYIDSIKI